MTRFAIGGTVFMLQGRKWRCVTCGERGVRTMKAIRHALAHKRQRSARGRVRV